MWSAHRRPARVSGPAPRTNHMSHLFLVAGDLGWQRRRNPMPAARRG